MGSCYAPSSSITLPGAAAWTMPDYILFYVVQKWDIEENHPSWQFNKWSDSDKFMGREKLDPEHFSLRTKIKHFVTRGPEPLLTLHHRQKNISIHDFTQSHLSVSLPRINWKTHGKQMEKWYFFWKSLYLKLKIR